MYRAIATAILTSGRRDMKDGTILISGLACLLVSTAHLHAQGDAAGDAPDRAEARDLTESMFRFDPAGDARLPRGLSLGLLQDGAEPSAPDDSEPDPEPPGWRFEPYVAGWIPLQLKGSVTLLGTTTNVDVDLDTIIDDLEWVIEGGFELTNDQWSITTFGFWGKLETESKTQGLLGERDTTLSLEEALLDVALLYRIGEWPLGNSETATWNPDLGPGLRYWHVDVEVDTKGALGIDPDLSSVDDWVDPLIVGRLDFRLSEKCDLRVRADVGGFGIGSASDLTWSVSATCAFKLSPNVSLLASYRFLDLDWSSGSGEDETAYDYYFHGPIIGVAFTF
jgi:opacity protein-like surface antigen